MRKLTVFIICVFCFHASYGEKTFVLTKEYIKAYDEILRLQLNSAQDIIDIEKRKNPDNVAYCYLEAYSDFLKAIISEELTYYSALQNGKDSRIKLIDQVVDHSPWKLYAQAQLHLQESVAAAKNGDMMKAAFNMRKSYMMFSQNTLKFPDFEPNKIGLGLLYIVIGSTPDSYRWIPGLFGMEGNVDKGIGMLQEILTRKTPTIDQWPYLYNECLFLTTFVTFNLANSNENLTFLENNLKDERLLTELKQNPLLIYAVASFYTYRGQNDKALALLRSRPLNNSYFNFIYLDYLTGIALLQKLDPRCRIYFLRYCTRFNGSNFKMSAYQRIAWSYLIENDTINYRRYIDRISYGANPKMENDKEAYREHHDQRIPNIELLKSRLLFDGGYYNEARKALITLPGERLTIEQQIEYLYRMARIYHMEGKPGTAKDYYFKVYNTGRQYPYYYAANAILNLGLIYEEEKNYREASSCFSKCLKLDFKDYRYSIHQKAKAGLNRTTHN